MAAAHDAMVGPPTVPLLRSASAPGDGPMRAASMSVHSHTHAHTPADAALRQPGHADDMAVTQDLIDDSVYKVTEHKQEVRLGLRHRNSFSVHKSHMGTHTQAHTHGHNTMAAILAAFAREDDGAPAASSRKPSDSSDHPVDVSASGGAASAFQPPKKKNPLKSMVKGVGSFLGVRKSKKKRQAEEQARQAAMSANGLPNARRVAGAEGYSMSTNPLMNGVPGGDAGAPSDATYDDDGSDDDDEDAEGVATVSSAAELDTDVHDAAHTHTHAHDAARSTDPVAVDPSPTSQASPSRMPPLPPIPPSPMGSPPPPPPPPPAHFGTPVHTHTHTLATGSPSNGARPPPPPPPPPSAATGLQSPVGRSPGMPPEAMLEGGPDAGFSLSGSADISGNGLLSTNHHSVSPARSILKTAPKRETPGSPGPSGMKRRISFADQQGHTLEQVRWCEDLHYSANSDHSESDNWEDGDKANCAVM